jgi:hypothetical protein
MKFAKQALICSCLLFAVPSQALEYETLLESGSWRLDLNTYDDGSLGCEGLTFSENGIVLSFVDWGNDVLSVIFYSEAWAFPSEEVATVLNVRVGGRAWLLDGQRSDSELWFSDRSDSPQLASLIEAISAGTSLDLANASGAHIASFSLSGSSAVFAAQTDCARMIKDQAPRDPFEVASDADAGDPFR